MRFRVLAGLLAAVAGWAPCALRADPLALHDGNFDDLVFDLKTSGVLTPGDTSTYGSVANGMTWSAATREIAASMAAFDATANPTKTAQFGTPEPIAVRTESVRTAAYWWKDPVPTESCLYFPQPMREYKNANGTATTNIFPQRIVMPVLDVGSNVTYYIRFRWDGNLRDSYEQLVFANGMHQTGTKAAGNIRGWGFGLCIYGDGRFEDKSAMNLRPYCGNADYNWYTTVYRGQWYEMVARYTAIPGQGTKLDLAMAQYCEGWPYYVTSFFTNARYDGQTIRWPDNNRFAATRHDANGQPVGNLIIGSNFGSDAKTWQPRNSASGHSFRGSIADLKIFNRALTDEEMRALLYRNDGSTVAAGSVNGKPDEFAAADDPDAADVYEPYSMPSQKMRGTLTAAHPEVTLKFPLYEEEEGLPTVLSIVPVPKNVGGTAPVRIYANGTLAGSTDLGQARERSVILRKRALQRDADGNLTLTIRRTGQVEGELGLDAIRLAGSWARGRTDRKSTDWCFRDLPSTIHPHVSYFDNFRVLVGAPHGLDHIGTYMSGQKNENAPTARGYVDNQTFDFFVPTALTNLTSTFTFGVMMSDYSYGKFKVTLNGTLFEEVSPPRAGEYSFTFPPGKLKVGLNSFNIYNSTINGRSAQTGLQYNTLYMDSVRYTFTPPEAVGFMMILKRKQQ